MRHGTFPVDRDIKRVAHRETSRAVRNREKFTMGFYFHALTRLLGAPGQFFQELPGEMAFQKSIGFLILSAFFSTVARLTLIRDGYLILSAIFFINAVVMPMIASTIAFLVGNAAQANRVRLRQCISVFAFASGTTMFISWMPLFVWLAEPWKWILVYKGMTRGCGLGNMRVVLIILVTVTVICLSFRLIQPYVTI